jgi:hypothetical protein
VSGSRRRGAAGVRGRRGAAGLLRARQGARAERRLLLLRRALERRLRARLRAPVVVHLQDNTHTMVSFTRERRGWRLRLHHMFLAASDEVVLALAGFVRGADTGASALLDKHIERHRAAIRRIPPAELRRRLRIEPVGRHHDLQRIFDALNRRYFAGGVRATITYGPAPQRRLPRKSIKLGSYSAEARVIRIHPALDQPRVPHFFVEWIVFHEMLHHRHRARRGRGGRQSVHTPQFLKHERHFPNRARAQAWAAKHLDLLLRAAAEAPGPGSGAR